MKTDLTPHLLIPTCAECDAIALREMPELLCDIEAEFGFDMLKEFLFAHGGGQYCVKRQLSPEIKASPLLAVHVWMRARLYGGTVTIPMGNLSLNVRLAWTIATHLRAGMSLAATARATGCDARTVSAHKKRLVKIGWLGPNCSPQLLKV